MILSHLTPGPINPSGYLSFANCTGSQKAQSIGGRLDQVICTTGYLLVVSGIEETDIAETTSTGFYSGCYR
jgi:hypothetical protein